MTAPVTRMGLEDFLALPDIDERRLELIDGEVYEKMSARWGHSTLAGELYRLLCHFGFPGVEPRAIIGGTDDCSPSSPLPDVAFYLADPPGPEDWMRRPPDVAIEILSPGQGRRDVRAKVDMYLRFGVRSVWVFDLHHESVDIFEGTSRRTLSRDSTLVTDAIPGVRIELAALFDRALGRGAGRD
ncbi:MAG: Uma2 family endonuclease [Dehalococcoidia bacterium]|nr:Uma2 family endonuclease [Dehalococcoidia bacterium]